MLFEDAYLLVNHAGEGEVVGRVADGDGEAARFYNEITEVGVVEGECLLVEMILSYYLLFLFFGCLFPSNP